MTIKHVRFTAYIDGKNTPVDVQMNDWWEIMKRCMPNAKWIDTKYALAFDSANGDFFESALVIFDNGFNKKRAARSGGKSKC